jgi:hypothetical protein
MAIGAVNIVLAYLVARLLAPRYVTDLGPTIFVVGPLVALVCGIAAFLGWRRFLRRQFRR